MHEINVWPAPECAAGEPLPGEVRCFEWNGMPGGLCWSLNQGVYNLAVHPCHLDTYLPNEGMMHEIDVWPTPACAAGEPRPGNARCFAWNGMPGGLCWLLNQGVNNHAVHPCHLDEFLPNEGGMHEVDTWLTPACAAGQALP